MKQLKLSVLHSTKIAKKVFQAGTKMRGFHGQTIIKKSLMSDNQQDGLPGPNKSSFTLKFLPGLAFFLLNDQTEFFHFARAYL